MKFFDTKYKQDIDKWYSVVPTEKTIGKQLLEYGSDKYRLIDFCLSDKILEVGVNGLQNVIDSVTEKRNKNIIFLCQHLYVNKLNFYGNVIASPHAYSHEGIVSVPHYPLKLREIDDNVFINKDILFSFKGYLQTHKCREGLRKLYPNNVHPIRCWGVGLPETKDEYLDMFERSKFSICPRGTGISSIRLYESINMGSVPIIVANGFKKPLDFIIDWDEFSITINENKINSIGDVLKNISDDKYSQMRKRLIDVKYEYFSIPNLYKSITLKLKI